MPKIIIFAFFLSIFSISKAQVIEKDSLSILIYQEGQGFLQPFIETTIKKLINVETNTSYFKSVNSFNTFINDNKYQSELSNLINSQKPENANLNLYYSDIEKNVRERIFKILKNYDYFLSIKTNTLGELIEFQFQLFETVNSKKNIPYNISDRVKKVENFFINPKEKEYLIEIKNALQRLFQNSNRKPISELKIFDELVRSNENIKIPLETEVELNGLNSGDFDSPSIKYLWRNIPRTDEKIQSQNKIKFEKNQPVQKITIDKPGLYSVGFKVYDGVQYSDEIILNLEPVLTPKITVKDSITNSSITYSLIGKNKERIIYNDTIFVNQSFFDENSKPSLIISKEPLGKKYSKNKHYTKIDTTAKIIYNDKSNSFVLLRSDFLQNLNKDEKIYIYNKSSFNLLSNEISITHKYRKRGLINLSITGMSSSLSKTGEDEEENSSLYSTYSGRLKLGLFVFHNLELIISMPLTRDIAEIEDLKINYPSLDSGIYYYLSRNSQYAKVGAVYRMYILDTELEQDEMHELEQYRGIGISIGAGFRILNREGFSLDLEINSIYSRFINERQLRKISDASFGIGLVYSLF